MPALGSPKRERGGYGGGGGSLAPLSCNASPRSGRGHIGCVKSVLVRRAWPTADEIGEDDDAGPSCSPPDSPPALPRDDDSCDDDTDRSASDEDHDDGDGPSPAPPPPPDNDGDDAGDATRRLAAERDAEREARLGERALLLDEVGRLAREGAEAREALRALSQSAAEDRRLLDALRAQGRARLAALAALKCARAEDAEAAAAEVKAAKARTDHAIMRARRAEERRDRANKRTAKWRARCAEADAAEARARELEAEAAAASRSPSSPKLSLSALERRLANARAALRREAADREDFEARAAEAADAARRELCRERVRWDRDRERMEALMRQAAERLRSLKGGGVEEGTDTVDHVDVRDDTGARSSLPLLRLPRPTRMAVTAAAVAGPAPAPGRRRFGARPLSVHVIEAAEEVDEAAGDVAGGAGCDDGWTEDPVLEPQGLSTSDAAVGTSDAPPTVMTAGTETDAPPAVAAAATETLAPAAVVAAAVGPDEDDHHPGSSSDRNRSSSDPRPPSPWATAAERERLAAIAAGAAVQAGAMADRVGAADLAAARLEAEVVGLRSALALALCVAGAAEARAQGKAETEAEADVLAFAALRERWTAGLQRRRERAAGPTSFGGWRERAAAAKAAVAASVAGLPQLPPRPPPLEPSPALTLLGTKTRPTATAATVSTPEDESDASPFARGMAASRRLVELLVGGGAAEARGR